MQWYDQRGETDQSGLSVTADGTTTTQSAEMSDNDMGQPTTMIYPDGEALTAQYDTNGYYRSSYFGTPSSTGSVNFLVGQATYTNAGQMAGMSIGGSAALTAQPTPVFSTTDTYDGIQRPVSVGTTRNGTTIWSQSKTYDNVGNTLNLSTTLPTTSGGTQTESQSFCYDALNRLVWAGDAGTPSGGDHCGSAPSGTSVSTYQQTFSYDALDRLISGPSGTETYGTTPTHGANTLSSVPNQYASYDTMGDMTCRDVDTTADSTQSCDASQTGALMSYDNEGRLSSWTAPGTSAATPSDQFLYDNAGTCVLQRVSNGSSSPTDTISFSGVTDVTINGSQTSTAKYYTADGQTVAMRQDGVMSYLVPDTLGSVSLTLYADGSTEAVQLYAPYGATRYSDGTTPTAYGFTGQRSDSTTGLMYYGARYYDPVSGRFISADNVETNATGQDTYSYVQGNPETESDPTGHRYISPPGGGFGGGAGGDFGGGASGGGSGLGGGASGGGSGDGGGGSGDGGGGSGDGGGGSGYGGAPPPSSPSAEKEPLCDAACAFAIIQAPVIAAVIAASILPDALLPDIGILALGIGEDGSAAYGIGEGGEAGGACSFTAATQVTTENGKQSIGSLKVGETVAAYNQKTKQIEAEVIRHVWINHDDDLVDLTLTTTLPASKGKPAHETNETLHTNMKHPFLTVEKGFVPVAQLKLGMHVVEAGNRTGVVTGWKSVSGAQTMYNLEVTQDHTYTVGNGQFVVHNTGDDCAQELKETFPDARSAYNAAMDHIGGPLGEDATPNIARGLAGDPDGVGGSPNGLQSGGKSWRIDYDPEKGPHFNWSVGKKRSGGIWGAARFPGTRDTYIDRLLRFGEGGVNSMLDE